MISLVRLNTLLPDGAVDYTDSVILRELNDALTAKFERAVTDARCGYWLQRKVYTTTAGNAILRMPPRACGLSKVEIGDASSTPSYKRLPLLREGHADLYTGPDGSIGSPKHWVMRGDRIHLTPTPDTAYSVRVSYYLRPSRLTPYQSGGYITAINTTTRVITIDAMPSSIAVDGTTSTIAVSAFSEFDVVSPTGWHEVQLVNEYCQRSATLQLTCLGTADLSSVRTGDVVRFAEQAEWPPIPDDFHRALVDIATIKILIQLDFQSKAGGFAQDANADMQRFTALIADRVQEEPQVPRADLPSLRRRW